MIDLDIPEVRSAPQVARFFRENNVDLVEISNVGMKDSVIRKVRPQDMAQWSGQWLAYQEGVPLRIRPGTPLTEIMPEAQAQSYLDRHVHNLEEFAVLSDAQCQGLGHGTITLRNKAREIITDRKNRKAASVMDRMSETAKVDTPAPNAEIAELKATVNTLAEQMAALVSIVSQQAQPPKRGRPRKDADGSHDPTPDSHSSV